jgi:hypothetical protein
VPQGDIDLSTRSPNPFAEPLHQRNLETLFEFMDLVRDRGLRKIEHRRRGCKAAALDHLDKRPKLIKVETAHGYYSFLSYRSKQ